ncbi:MAG: sialate O-acetylesterase [Alistipes communis]
MKHAFLLALNLCLAAAACARPDTVYVAHGAAHTPRIELADGHAIESRPMPGDTLTAGGVCFVRLPRLRLVLCIGQSNMAGRGLMDAGAADTLRGVSPLQRRRLRTRRGTHEPLLHRPQVNSACSASAPLGSFAASLWRRSRSAPGGVVVNARGGSSIDEWPPGSETDYLAKAVERIRAAGDWGDVGGGASASGRSRLGSIPERYEAKLRRLVGILRTELGNPSLPVVFGEIAH